MNFEEVDILQKNRVTIKNLLPEIGIEQARTEIINGLISEIPFISSKFFYDEKGSQLFEEITKLEEYYPTLTEKKILREIAPELMNRNSSFEIIELGSGDCSKISILLDAVENQNLENLRYIPVDFSKSAIEDSANELAERFPNLEINGYVADFTNQIGLVPHSEKPRIICFLGSTIGNFSKKESIDILINLSKGLLPGDSLLVGFDMIKDERILYSAYNDAKGITSEFNKNILNVVNQIAKTNFNPDYFEHHSFFNEEKSRNEMHLVANRDCKIESPFIEKPLDIKIGDKIHTENSYKYDSQMIMKLSEETGLSINNLFADKKNWFLLVEYVREY